MKNILLLLFCFCIPILISAQVNVEVDNNGQMFISKTAFVYVSNSGSVNVNDDTTNPGQLIMDSDSNEFSNLFVDGSSTGTTAEYWRWTATAATRDLIAPPVSGEPFNVFYARNSAKLVGGTYPSAPTGSMLFGNYDNTSTTGYYNEFLNTATTVIAGTPGTAYRTASSGGALQFKGKISTNNVVVPITYGGASPTVRFGETNLIGNPYTTYISAVDLLNAMASGSALDPVYTYIYAYDGSIGTGINSTNGSYWERINLAYIAALSGTPGDINIAPGQGFLVYSDNDGGSITFTKSMQRILTDGDDFIAGRSSNSSSPLNTNLDAAFQLKIEDTSNSKSNNTQLYFFDNNVSRGLDVAWDAGARTSGFSISTLLAEDNEGIPFDLQCLDSSDILSLSSDVVIPIHIIANAGVDYKISIENENIPTGSTIYLHDALNDSLTLLNDEDYTFNPSEALTGAGRFYLRTSSNSLSNDDYAFNSLNVKSILNSKTLLVEGQLASETLLNLYDVSGRLIITYTLNANAQVSERYIDVSSINNGIYVAQLTNNSNQTKTNKVIIK